MTPSSLVILVVDDDPLIRAGLRRHLARACYAVEEADSGPAALAFAERSRADLVILDLRMPGMDGLETCRSLKALPAWADTPVLILTGHQDSVAFEAAIAAGADDFLTKPVQFQELSLRLHALLRLKRVLVDLRASVETIQAQQEVIERTQVMRQQLEAFLLHDLKSPVATILLQAEMKVEAGTDAPAWGRVLNDAERLMKLVTGWMDHIHSEHGGLQPRIATLQTRSFLEGVLARHRLWLQVKHLQGRVEVEEDCGTLCLDATLMERVLGNLLENCIRYGPAGTEILMAVRSAPDGRVRLEVADEGPGVPSQLRETIFDLYVQLEASTGMRTARESRGLGLAFCRLAVEAHRGTIHVEDRAGGGSSFVILLPARS